MPSHTILDLQVNQILLDSVNPRHDPLNSQVEQIKAMINSQMDKLVKLAEDITAFGLNPSDLITVIPHSSEKDKYIVVEGNRRITALKLLNSPALCHDTGIRRRFEALKKLYVMNPIYQIKSIVYSDRETAKHWISLKHTGENAGAGTVPWKPIEIKRFQAQGQNNKESLGLQLMNFILNNLALDDESTNIIRAMPITTVERLLGDPDVRKTLGLSIVDGVLETKLTKECAARVLYDLITPIATGDKKVTSVYYKKDRKRYMEEFGQSPLEAPENLTADSWPLNSPPKSAPQKMAPHPPTTRSKPLSIARKYVIPAGCALKIINPRINAIYYELKNHLKVDDVPNACAVLLRVFIELSVDAYCTNSNTGTHENDDLHKKLSKIADYMENTGLMRKSDLKPIRKAASVPHGLFSTNTLNAYVHNSSIHPRSNELKLTWDEMELFVRKLWS